MKNNEEALKELNLKCFVLSIYALALLVIRFATTPEVHFALRHMDDQQAITDYARKAGR